MDDELSDVRHEALYGTPERDDRCACFIASVGTVWPRPAEQRDGARWRGERESCTSPVFNGCRYFVCTHGCPLASSSSFFCPAINFFRG